MLESSGSMIVIMPRYVWQLKIKPEANMRRLSKREWIDIAWVIFAWCLFVVLLTLAYAKKIIKE